MFFPKAAHENESPFLCQIPIQILEKQSICEVSPLRDEVLLFRQKDSKAFPPVRGLFEVPSPQPKS